MKVHNVSAASLDPITKGHSNFLEKEARKVDKLTVSMGDNAKKTPLFSLHERVKLVRGALAKNLQNIEVTFFRGALAYYMWEESFNTLIRGMRGAADAEEERLLNDVNKSQGLDIDTQIRLSDQNKTHISSTVVKGMTLEHMDIRKFVPLNVRQALHAKMHGLYIFGVTGADGVGKDEYCETLIQELKELGIRVFHINMNEIIDNILTKYEKPGYFKVRKEIAKEFGEELMIDGGMINKQRLGEIVYSEPEKILKLNKILLPAIRVRLSREFYGKQGIVLLNSSLLTETDMTYMANNNVLLLNDDESERENRLLAKGFDKQQIDTRINHPFTNKKKGVQLVKLQRKDNFGNTIEIDNSSKIDKSPSQSDIMKILSIIDVYGELRIRSLLHKLGVKGNYKEIYCKIKGLYEQRKTITDWDRDSQDHNWQHNWFHIIDCLDEFAAIKDRLKEEGDGLSNYLEQNIELALIFHDVVYDTRSDTNEEDSAIVAEKLLEALGLDKLRIESIKKLIMLTRHNKESENMVEQIMMDIDLTVLGKNWEEYKQYANDVRKEYFRVDDITFNSFRIAKLEAFLLRDSIYQTQYFRDKYENQAQENIRKEIEEMDQKIK